MSARASLSWSIARYARERLLRTRWSGIPEGGKEGGEVGKKERGRGREEGKGEGRREKCLKCYGMKHPAITRKQHMNASTCLHFLTTSFRQQKYIHTHSYLWYYMLHIWIYLYAHDVCTPMVFIHDSHLYQHIQSEYVQHETDMANVPA